MEISPMHLSPKRFIECKNLTHIIILSTIHPRACRKVRRNVNHDFLTRVGRDKSLLQSVNLCMCLLIVLRGQEVGRQNIRDLSVCQSQYR